ncbi:MAG: response regulator [Candidatus Eisenbacteria bacterium]|nr:response regulator [Candidatus Eisenbacteria bacterium]
MSWSPRVELTSLFAEVLDELAAALAEPACPRGPGMLRLAAADAALIGFENLSSALKSYARRIEGFGTAASPAPPVFAALAALARELTDGIEADFAAAALERALNESGSLVEAPRPAPVEPALPVLAAPPSAPVGPIPSAPVAPPLSVTPPSPPPAATGVSLFVETPPGGRTLGRAPEEALPPPPPATVRIYLETPGTAEPAGPAAGSLHGSLPVAPPPASSGGFELRPTVGALPVTRRALLADPAPVSRALLARMMRRLVWQVEELSGAVAALQALVIGVPDVLIVDAHRLPVAPRAIMDEGVARNVPVVFVVDESRPEEERALARAGAVLLRRPTDETALLRVLDNLRPTGGTA